MNKILGDKEKIRFNNYAGLWINERSLAAGALTVVLMATVGIYLSRTVAVSIDNIYSPLLAALFTGAATGQYLGAASEKVGETIRSYLLGFTVALSAVLLAVFQASILSAVLLVTLATVFLVHSSGMVVQKDWVNRAIELLAGRGSLAGLASLAVYHFVVPAVVNLSYLIIYDFNLVGVV